MPFNYKIPDNIDPKLFECFYNEIFYEYEYDRFGVSVEPGDVVLDAGANIGLFTDYAIIRGAQKIISIEADVEIYKALRQNITSKKVLFKCGLVSDKVDDGHYNLEKIFKYFNLSTIDFAKIDIEGYEYDFILNSNTNFLNKIKKMAIEVHLFSNEHLHLTLNLIEKLSINGFKVYYYKAHPNTNLGLIYAQNESFSKLSPSHDADV